MLAHFNKLTNSAQGKIMEKKKIQKKVKKVLAEFEKGALKSSSGKPVVKKDMALAIGYSEAGASKKKK
jgi:hypothetical protein